MSGECNICGGEHAEGTHPPAEQVAYSNGYEAGWADGYNRAMREVAARAVERGVDDILNGKVKESE